MATGVFECVNDESGMVIPETFKENLTSDPLYCWLEVVDGGLTCVTVCGEDDFLSEDIADMGITLMKATFSDGILHIPDELRRKLGDICVAAAINKRIDIWPENDWEIFQEERLTPENFAAALEELGL